MAERNATIAKNTIVLYLRMVIVLFVTFFTTRILLRNLGVSDYGVYNVVGGFVSLFSFINASMANAVQRFYNYEIGKNKGNNMSVIYTSALLIQGIIAITIIVFTESIGMWYINNKMVLPTERLYAASWVFQTSVISLVILVLQTPFTAAVMAYERMGIFAVISMFDALGRLLAVFLLSIMDEDKLITFGCLSLLISLVDFIAYFIYSKIHFKKLQLNKRLNKRIIVSMFSFSGWNLFGSFAHLAQSQGLNIIINVFWGTILNAAYGIANQVQNGIRNLNTSFITAVRPRIIHDYAKGEEGSMMELVFTSSKVSYYLVLLLVLPLSLTIIFVLNIWLGEGNYPEITPVLCILNMIIVQIESLATPISIIVHATGKMKKFQVICSIVIISVIPISTFIASLGASPSLVLVSSIMVCIITHCVRLYLIKQLITFSIYTYIKEVIIPIICVSISSFTLSIIMYQLFQGTFFCEIMVGILSMVSIPLCVLICGLNNREKDLLKSFINIEKWKQNYFEKFK